MKVKIRDIAILARVSPGTVDRVIHNRGEVSEKTRLKVQKILKEVDYQPDIFARNLASRRAWKIAVFIPVSVNENDFWSAPGKGIEKALKEIAPFNVEVNYYLYDQGNRDFFAAKAFDLLSDKPDAVLFAPVFAADSLKFIHECEMRNIQLTLFNSYIEGMNETNFIGQNAYQSGAVAARLLAYSCHDPSDLMIINLGSGNDHQHLFKREQGFREFFENRKLKGVNLYSLDSINLSEDAFYNKLSEALNHRNVRGIFVTNSKVYKIARFLKKNHSRHINTIGYDLLPANIDYLKNETIDFLIGQRPEEQAYKGLLQIFNILVMNKKPESANFIPVDIITRENIDNYEYN